MNIDGFYCIVNKGNIIIYMQFTILYIYTYIYICVFIYLCTDDILYDLCIYDLYIYMCKMILFG